jgi:hypothetical protein
MPGRTSSAATRVRKFATRAGGFESLRPHQRQVNTCSFDSTLSIARARLIGSRLGFQAFGLGRASARRAGHGGAGHEEWRIARRERLLQRDVQTIFVAGFVVHRDVAFFRKRECRCALRFDPRAGGTAPPFPLWRRSEIAPPFRSRAAHVGRPRACASLWKQQPPRNRRIPESSRRGFVRGCAVLQRAKLGRLRHETAATPAFGNRNPMGSA